MGESSDVSWLEDYAFEISLISMFACFIITGIQIVKHLANYSNPFVQNKILIILFFAPFFTLCSTIGIGIPETADYMDVTQGIYESLLVYAFFKMLVRYITVDREENKIEMSRLFELLATKGLVEHAPPVKWFLPADKRFIKLISVERARWFYNSCKRGVVQFIPFLLLFSLLELGNIGFGDSVPIKVLFTIMIFTSPGVAVYYVLIFVKVLYTELKSQRPLQKFLPIKGILFLSTWQRIILSFLADYMVDFNYTKFWTNEYTNLLINGEMIVLSILTAVYYSHKSFAEEQGVPIHVLSIEGIQVITENLVKDVIVQNAKDTIDDIKHLAQPLLDKNPDIHKTDESKIVYRESLEANLEQKTKVLAPIKISPHILLNGL
jgi:hypothetical protein